MKTKILVCCHKNDICVTVDPYLPLHVGKALSSLDLKILGDDTGDNISKKNASFCELTGLYWAWKNLRGVDIVGLCHYRRYFDFHNQCRKGFPIIEIGTEQFETIDLSVPANYIESLQPNEIIVPKPYIGNPLLIDYCCNHISDDFRTLCKVIRDNCGLDDYNVFKKVIMGNRIRIANMFIMRWNDFDKYCNWLFSILFEVEKRIDIASYSNYQRRVFGFMSERLLNVYIEKNRMKVRDLPIITLTDTFNYDYNQISLLRYKLRCLRHDLIAHLLIPSEEIHLSRI